jgi:hypothetical protein
MTDATKIAPTAHYTAYAWHVLGLPHAEYFATPLGKRLFHAYRLLELPATLRGEPSKLLRTLRNRHTLIDAELERIQPDVVVELGAGLSRRGLTFALDAGVRYVEIDLPAMVAYKRQLLATRVPAALQERLGVGCACWTWTSSRRGFADALAQELRGAQRPVIIAEGVVGYFEADQRSVLLERVRRALPATGTFLGHPPLQPEDSTHLASGPNSPCCKALWAPRTEVRGSIPGLDQLRKSAPCRARTASFKVGCVSSSASSTAWNSTVLLLGTAQSGPVRGWTSAPVRAWDAAPAFKPGCQYPLKQARFMLTRACQDLC